MKDVKLEMFVSGNINTAAAAFSFAEVVVPDDKMDDLDHLISAAMKGALKASGWVEEDIVGADVVIRAHVTRPASAVQETARPSSASAADESPFFQRLMAATATATATERGRR